MSVINDDNGKEKKPNTPELGDRSREALIQCIRESMSPENQRKNSSLLSRFITYFLLLLLPYVIIVAAFSTTKYGPSAGGLFNKNAANGDGKTTNQLKK